MNTLSFHTKAIMNISGARILVRGETSDKILYANVQNMNSSQVVYCNGVAKISVRAEDIQQKCAHQRLLKHFEKFIKTISTKI